MVTTREIVDQVCSEASSDATERRYLHYAMGRESGGRADAKNPKSSATGLFQFLNQTWLAQIKADGEKYGYGRYADAIYRGSDGKLHARDGLEREILNLRYNAEASTQMMVEFTRDNAAIIERVTGRDATAGELYLAHFLGAGGASNVLRANPGAKLADLPGGAAVIASNPTLRGYSAGQVRAWAEAKANKQEFRASVDYHYNPAPSDDEQEEERRRRRNRLGVYGVSEERIDEMDASGDLMGNAFFVVLIGLIAGLSQIKPSQAAEALPELAAAAAVPAASQQPTQTAETAPRAAAMDEGLAAAIADLPASLRGQQAVSANQNSPTSQLPERARPAQSPALTPAA